MPNASLHSLIFVLCVAGLFLTGCEQAAPSAKSATSSSQAVPYDLDGKGMLGIARLTASDHTRAEQDCRKYLKIIEDDLIRGGVTTAKALDQYDSKRDRFPAYCECMIEQIKDRSTSKLQFVMAMQTLSSASSPIKTLSGVPAFPDHQKRAEAVGLAAEDFALQRKDLLGILRNSSGTCASHLVTGVNEPDRRRRR